MFLFIPLFISSFGKEKLNTGAKSTTNCFSEVEDGLAKAYCYLDEIKTSPGQVQDNIA